MSAGGFPLLIWHDITASFGVTTMVSLRPSKTLGGLPTESRNKEC